MSSSQIEKLVSELLKKKLDEIIPNLRAEITKEVLASLKKEEVVPKKSKGSSKKPETSEDEEMVLSEEGTPSPAKTKKCSIDFDKMKYAELMCFIKEKGGKDFKCSKGKKATLAELKECAKKLALNEKVEKPSIQEKPIAEKKSKEPKKLVVNYDDTYKVYTDENKKYIFHTTGQIIGKLNKNIKIKCHYQALVKKDVDELKKAGLQLYHVLTLKRTEPLSKEELIQLIGDINKEIEEGEEDVSSSASSESEEKLVESSSEEELSEEDKKEEESSAPEDDDLEEDEKEIISAQPEKDVIENLEEAFSRNLAIKNVTKEIAKEKIEVSESSSESSSSEDEVVNISKADFEKYRKYQKDKSTSKIGYDSSIGLSKVKYNEIVKNYVKYEKQFSEKSKSKDEKPKSGKKEVKPPIEEESSQKENTILLEDRSDDEDY